jgi:hypothetical protein
MLGIHVPLVAEFGTSFVTSDDFHGCYDAVGKCFPVYPSETKVTYTKAKLTMKEQATNTRDKPSQIFAQALANCNDYVQAMMPREENCKRIMRCRVGTADDKTSQ